MSDITISQLPTKTQLLDADMVVIDDGAQSYKMYYAQFKNLFRQAFQELFVDAAGDTMTGALVMDGVKVVHRANAQDYPVLDTRDIPGGGVVGFIDTTAPVDISSGFVTPASGWIYISGDAGGLNMAFSPLRLYYNGSVVWSSAVSARDGRDGLGYFTTILPVGAGITVTADRAANLRYYPNL